MQTLHYRNLIALVMLILGLTVLQSTASAQLPRQLLNDADSKGRLNRNAPEIIAESAPSDDEVLTIAPSLLGLNFPQNVRLVKLVLYNEKKEWIDLDFRYDPRPGSSFNWPVPDLQQTSYYTADWAVLAAGDLLVRGSFSFTFGAGAEPPSVQKERELILLEMRNGNATEIERLRDLGLDPAEIIINNDEPRRFEPPFSPILN